ncbi:protein kinase domain-containing protein [Streptomyces sp. CWNU-52B]|uniref:serine/threonine-protein kinase n=1 Tax=unclassified Streptomyces TaxID=2593676 RepID=UPI0039C24B0A
MGEVFAGRYELVDPIGRGGVGAVWRAWDHRRRRYVAAKVLQQSDAHSLLRFVREQAVRIDHPHVLAPASWAADDDKVLFTMDLVGGGSLVHLIGDYGPLPPAFVCTLLDQLLAGLAAVHAEGIVHRDIKPANILLEATGTGRPRLRLSDFGISMRLGEPRLTETNYVVGTPGYFAPEQMLGADPDFPADLFAVGLVALYLLEGAKPDAKALIEHFAAHGTPGAPKGIPEPLWQVVASLLEPNPQARFRTATGARKALVPARELLPEPGPDDELIEIFDQLGPLPSGFGPEGPLTATTAPSPPQSHPGRQGRERERERERQGQQGQGEGQGEGQPPPREESRSHGHDLVPRSPGTSASPPPPRTGEAPPAAHLAPDPSSPARTPPDRSTPGRSTPERPSGDIPLPPLPTASDTGSFHLPPPPPPQSPAPPAYSPSLSYEPTQVPTTASYTARDVRVPSGQQAQQPPQQPVARHRGRRARRQHGPPTVVTVPVLLLALVCFGVGFWALTQI